MIPVKQKNLHNPEKGIIGDCFRAAICSLLEISDNGVENFVESSDYPMNVVHFLKQHGVRMYHSTTYPEGQNFCIANGLSPRGVRHSVIFNVNGIVHDPHPSNGGIAEPDLYLWFEPLENHS